MASSLLNRNTGNNSYPIRVFILINAVHVFLLIRPDDREMHLSIEPYIFRICWAVAYFRVRLLVSHMEGCGSNPLFTLQ